MPTIAVRLGDIDPGGAYFSLPGSSTYFDPADRARDCYDVTGVNILDWRDPALAVELLRRTRELANDSNATPQGFKRLQEELEWIEQGEAPHIGYMLADETPMAQAAAGMGFGGLLVMENDDWAAPSSVFITDVAKVRKLSSEERTEFLCQLEGEGEVEPAPRVAPPRMRPG